MKILFLDIDGVLNSAQSAHFYHKERAKAKAGDPAFMDALGRRPLREDEFCPMACSNLQDLLEDIPALRIVVSSTWRKNRSIEQLRAILAKAGVEPSRVIGKTPDLYRADNSSEDRGIEIQAWLDAHNGSVMMPIESFAIVDDDSDMAHLMNHLIQTDYRVGLDFVKANEIKRFFLVTSKN